MEGESWSLAGAKVCDSCKTTSASLYCRADSAFLCMACDAKVHAANKLASRHARVWMCEVCEQAPATVTCKADAAALCATCDRDIHSVNPLARRHERFPLVPFYDPSAAAAKSTAVHGDDRHFSDEVETAGDESEEAEAASWLLPTPNPNSNTNKIVVDSPELKSADYLFNDMDPYLDLDVLSPPRDQKQHNHHQNNQYSSSGDGVVPVHPKNFHHQAQPQPQPPMVDGYPTYVDMDYSGSKTKPFMYNFSSQSISQSVSSSSVEVGVVPDHNNTMADVSNNSIAAKNVGFDAGGVPNPVSGMDREARVLRYREKRKNRKFEKTIRYASRKAYAETRPRIKGRFAKRSEIEVEPLMPDTSSYGLVPSY